MPLRLRRVPGLEPRANDVVFAPARAEPSNPRSPSRQALLYFGGDVQDYPEVMQAHRDNRNYLKWNLESTARMLALYFPTKHILVIKPSRVEYKSFSCYDNFVPSNTAGVPDHTPTHSALLHLERLLQGVTSRLKTMPTSELLEAVSAVSLPEEIDIEELHNPALPPPLAQSSANGSGALKADLEPLWWRDQLQLDECSLTLVGFSKGCVVLNQLIYEFHYTKTLTPGDAHMIRYDPYKTPLLGHHLDKCFFKLNFRKGCVVLNQLIYEFHYTKTLTPGDAHMIRYDPYKTPLLGHHLDDSFFKLSFSKGCVVLNQLIYEFHYTKTLTPGDAHMIRFIERIEDMYWLDGGHAGGKNTWITSRSLLETLTRLNVNIYVHVSPYQVHDEGRPWIGREEKQFTTLLRKLGANVQRYLHASAGAPQSLPMHFDVLTSFKRVQDQAEQPALSDSSDDES